MQNKEIDELKKQRKRNQRKFDKSLASLDLALSDFNEYCKTLDEVEEKPPERLSNGKS